MYSTKSLTSCLACCMIWDVLNLTQLKSAQISQFQCIKNISYMIQAMFFQQVGEIFGIEQYAKENIER